MVEPQLIPEMVIPNSSVPATMLFCVVPVLLKHWSVTDVPEQAAPATFNLPLEVSCNVGLNWDEAH